MGVLLLACAASSLRTRNTAVSMPFLLLFATGYLYVGLTSLWIHLRGRRVPTAPALAPAA